MVNILTPICGTGYGYVGVNLALALERAGHRPALWPIGPTEVENRHATVLQELVRRQGLFDWGAPSLRVYHQFSLAEHVGGGLRCALPIFELDRFTAVEYHHLSKQDYLFVPSEWAATVLAGNGLDPNRIFVAPLGVDGEVFQPAPAKEPKPGPTIFFNAGKWEVRKGHDVLLEAFCKAFSPADDVVLRMVSQNPVSPDAERYNREWNECYTRSPLGPKVELYGRLPTQADLAALMASSDCGVFPARAEGWNMELAEMLAMGLPCIATDYSAHTEYVRSSGAHLISVTELEPAHDGVWFHGQGNWARFGDDQMDQLVTHLREVHRQRQRDGALPPNKDGLLAFKTFTWDNTAKKIMEVLG